MPHVYSKTFFGNKIDTLENSKLSVAGSAVLYGLSVYTVIPVQVSESGQLVAFRMSDHYERLVNSAQIIGIDTFETDWNEEKFEQAVKKVIEANEIKEDVFVRATVHVDEMLPGVRSRGLKTLLSIFICEAAPILPQNGGRLKTSVWRRIPDYSIPSRAKVNGAYINSVLAKQDALDSGYDDCIFLDSAGHVCELSAANIFLIRDGVLITPDTTTDLLEGITRKTIIEIAKDLGIKVEERNVDLTELYIANEVFASGTSAYVSPILEIDARIIGKKIGSITKKLRDEYLKVLQGENNKHDHWYTKF